MGVCVRMCDFGGVKGRESRRESDSVRRFVCVSGIEMLRSRDLAFPVCPVLEQDVLYVRTFLPGEKDGSLIWNCRNRRVQSPEGGTHVCGDIRKNPTGVLGN